MDLTDLCWQVQQAKAITELWDSLDAGQSSAETKISTQAKLIALMQQEKDDLRLRLAVLIRLLTEQGVVSKDQFGAAVEDAKVRIAEARAQVAERQAALTRSKRPTRTGLNARQ